MTQFEEENAQVQQARVAFRSLYLMSQLMRRGLYQNAYNICTRLSEYLFNPIVIGYIDEEILMIEEQAINY